MGFFDFLKKKAEPAHEAETVSYSELDNWVSAKKEIVGKQEQGFLSQIKSRLLQLTKELDEGVALLANMDVKQKRGPEKALLVVEANLDNYAGYLDELVTSLRNLDETNPNKLIEELHSLVTIFEKRSSASFQKANILIGKELDQVRMSIVRFFKDLKNLQQANKKVITTSKALSAVSKKLNELAELEKVKGEFEGKVKSHQEKITELERKKQELDKEISELKATQEYRDKLGQKAEIGKLNAELGRDIQALRDMIDFKALASEYHTEEKKMKIVNEHKSNFQEALERDNGLKLVSLLDDAKLNDSRISGKINEILKKRADAEKTVAFGTEHLEAEARRIDSEIESLNSELAKEKKKHERIDLSKSEIKGLMQTELSNINVTLS